MNQHYHTPWLVPVYSLEEEPWRSQSTLIHSLIQTCCSRAWVFFNRDSPDEPFPFPVRKEKWIGSYNSEQKPELNVLSQEKVLVSQKLGSLLLSGFLFVCFKCKGDFQGREVSIGLLVSIPLSFCCSYMVSAPCLLHIDFSLLAKDWSPLHNNIATLWRQARTSL